MQTAVYRVSDNDFQGVFHTEQLAIDWIEGQDLLHNTLCELLGQDVSTISLFRCEPEISQTEIE